MDTNYDIRIEELYLPSKNSKDSYLCEDFIIYPEGKEKNGGYIMGIIEIRTTELSTSERIIQTIVNTLKEEYYKQINASPDPTKLNLETVFEYSLQKTNDKLTEMIEIGSLTFALENLNYIIAVAKPNQKTKDVDFIFTHQGLINCHLIHKTKQNNFKVINIIGNTPKNSDENHDKFKIFSSILSGKVFTHDTLYLSTELFNNYIPSHKVNQILNNNPLLTAVNYFKNLINNNDNKSYLTYCAIFVKIEQKKDLDNSPISQKSLNTLIDTSDNTEKILAPNLFTNIRSQLHKITTKIKDKTNSNSRIKAPTHQKRVKFGFFKYLINIFSYIYSGLKNTSAFIINLFKKEKNKTSKKDILTKLNKNSKTILITTAILLIAIVGSVFWIKHYQANQKIEAEYNNQIQIIQDQLDNAQVNLIYKNEDESLKLVKQASEEIEYLPQATETQINKYNELKGVADSLKSKLLNIEKTAPRLVTEINVENADINLDKIYYVADLVFVQSTDNKVFYYNTTDKKTSQPIPNDYGKIVQGSSYENEVVFLTDQNKLITPIINDNIFTNKPIDLSGVTPTNICLYGNNLYVLDNQAKTIYKFTGSNTSFSNKSTWLKSGNVSDKAIDIDVDGNIYVLNNDGTINKFYSGEPIGFNLGLIDPALVNPVKLETKLDDQYLYIFDKDTKRIIIVNKEGKIIKQKIFENIEDQINDVTVNEKDNIIWLTTKNKIYQANIN